LRKVFFSDEQSLKKNNSLFQIEIFGSIINLFTFTFDEFDVLAEYIFDNNLTDSELLYGTIYAKMSTTNNHFEMLLSQPL